MKLDAAQQQKVAGWIAEGLQLADIQKRLSAEFGLNLTYMEARFLVDDLKLVPRDVERPKAEVASPLVAAANAPTSAPRPEPGPAKPQTAASTPGAGQVSVAVDTVTRPGAMVSGSVTFSDGQSGSWYMDQMGRLGVVPKQQGYKPAAADVEQFQRLLEQELAKLGY